MKYRAEIDGLRALAVLPVILFHAGFEWFRGGFVGVDVFFVISGYLITTIIISEMAVGKFSIINFYERRARRILPALFFVMAACLPFAWFWLAPMHLKDFGQSLVAVSTFSSNILFWWESGYFDTAAELKPLLHTWSLAVEEQFYLLFPLLLMITWRLGVRWILTLLVLVFLCSLALAQWGAYNYPTAAFYMLPTRGWELLVGVFAAFYLKYNTHLESRALNQALSLLGLSMLVYSVMAFDETTPFPSLYTLMPVLGTCLLIVCAVPQTISHKLLSLKLLVGLGLISYSAYLWHQPLLVFARHRMFGEMSTTIVTILCLSSLAMAWVSWRFVEKPFRDKKNISFRSLLLFCATTSLLFIGLGFFSHVNDGFRNRINADIELSTISPSPLRNDCHSKETPCEYYGETVEWATFGDSHVVELSYALAELLKQYNLGVEHNSYTSCKPSLSDVDSRCYVWINQTLERLVESKTIKNVVMSFRLTSYLYGESAGLYPTLPDNKTDREKELLWDEFLEIVRKISQSDKQVYFVVQAPELPRYIEELAFWDTSVSSERIKGATLDWWLKRNAFVFERLDDLPEEIVVIDPKNLFCDQTWCYANDSIGFFYFDDDHMSVYGSAKVMDEIPIIAERNSGQ